MEGNNKKKLAEKVAGMLGYTRCKELPVEHIQGRNYEYWTEPGEKHPACTLCPSFSWPTAGLCIEKAREMGWRFWYESSDPNCFVVCFTYRTKPHEAKNTREYSIQEYGDIEAILRAFAEIPMEMEG